jgi:dihydrofolate reductase
MTARLVYGMQLSLDGYIEGPNGDLSWNRVDEELHRHFNEQEREAELLLYGRRLYELMAAYWPTARDDESLPDYMREYSEIWRSKPKVVFSGTLEGVEWNSRLVKGPVGEEVARLKAEHDGSLSVGGATLAGELIALGLVDEFQLYLTPVILGGGKSMFGPVPESTDLRLVETRTFASGVVLLRYEHQNEQEETGA